MPTQQDVIDAFDSLGGKFNQPLALAKALEDLGFDSSAVATAIHAALVAGALIQEPSGSIRKP
jgi:hypothetical protein